MQLYSNHNHNRTTPKWSPVNILQRVEREKTERLCSEMAPQWSICRILSRKESGWRGGCVSIADLSKQDSKGKMPAKVTTQWNHQRARMLPIRGNYVMQTNSLTPAETKLPLWLICLSAKTLNISTILSTLRTTAGHSAILSSSPKPGWGEWRAGNVNRDKPEGICGSTAHITICQFDSMWESKGWREMLPFSIH